MMAILSPNPGLCDPKLSHVYSEKEGNGENRVEHNSIGRSFYLL